MNEVRDAVRSPSNVPLPRQNDAPGVAAPDDRPQIPDPTYDSSIPIRVGQDSSPGGAAEIFLGVSVKQIVKEIPPPAPVIGAGPPAAAKSSAAPGKIIGSAGGGGSASTGGNWLGGGFLSAEGSGGGSGFGFDLRPMAFPTDVGDPNYRGPGRNEEEVSKSLKRLRRIVLDLVFNPFVYFGCLIVSVLMFMARFRTG